MKKITAMFTLMAAIICQLSFGQSKMSGNADPATITFITNATMANMKEIVTGKLAEKKGKDPSVRAYGAKMVEHHTMATKQMMAIVKSKGIKVPKTTAAMAMPDSSLANASGAAFDRMYVTMMIMDHKNTIALFETASTSLPDPDLKAFALKTLPLLREHLAEIQSIASKMNISATE